MSRLVLNASDDMDSWLWLLLLLLLLLLLPPAATQRSTANAVEVAVVSVVDGSPAQAILPYGSC